MKTIGLARLGRDAEIRYMPNGDAVCNLSLAVSYGKKAEGEQYRPTQWIDAALFGKRAESLAPYLLKNTVHCFTLSDAHIETYQKNGGGGDGVKMVAIVLDVELGPNGSAGQQQAPAQRPGHTPQAGRRPAPNFSDMDDDIPF